MQNNVKFHTEMKNFILIFFSRVDLYFEGRKVATDLEFTEEKVFKYYNFKFHFH